MHTMLDLSQTEEDLIRPYSSVDFGENFEAQSGVLAWNRMSCGHELLLSLYFHSSNFLFFSVLCVMSNGRRVARQISVQAYNKVDHNHQLLGAF